MTDISLLVKEVTEKEQNNVSKIEYVLEKPTVASDKYFLPFMEKGGSLLLSNQPLKRAEPRSHPHATFLYNPF